MVQKGKVFESRNRLSTAAAIGFESALREFVLYPRRAHRVTRLQRQGYESAITPRLAARSSYASAISISAALEQPVKAAAAFARQRRASSRYRPPGATMLSQRLDDPPSSPSEVAFRRGLSFHPRNAGN